MTPLTDPDDASLEAAHVGDERGRYLFSRNLIGAAWSRLRCARADLVHRLRRAGVLVAERLRSAWSRRFVRLAAPSLALLLFLPAAGFVQYVYFDRSGLHDLAPFIRFEPPTIGKVYDGRGRVLIELAREYRRVVSYDEVPLILRQAILAAEDKNFLSHGGVDDGSLPRVLQKTAMQSLATLWRGGAGAPGCSFPRVALRSRSSSSAATSSRTRRAARTPAPSSAAA